MKVYILGAGGHAKVVLVTSSTAGWEVGGIFDDDPFLLGKEVLGVPVLGAMDEAFRSTEKRLVIGIGSNDVRARLDAAAGGSTSWITVVHPMADVHESVRLGSGTVVFSGAVVQPCATLGRHCIVNTGATVDHDSVIGDYVHIAPGVHLAGGVHIGSRTLIGIGACVIPGVRIGQSCLIGAGAVVVRDVPDGVTAVGVPARFIH